MKIQDEPNLTEDEARVLVKKWKETFGTDLLVLESPHTSLPPETLPIWQRRYTRAIKKEEARINSRLTTERAVAALLRRQFNIDTVESYKLATIFLTSRGVIGRHRERRIDHAGRRVRYIRTDGRTYPQYSKD